MQAWGTWSRASQPWYYRHRGLGKSHVGLSCVMQAADILRLCRLRCQLYSSRPCPLQSGQSQMSPGVAKYPWKEDVPPRESLLCRQGPHGASLK